jgi:hypothetical protein
MQDLRRHISHCPDCREQYREFTQFLLPQLFISADSDVSFETGYSSSDRKRLREEFLAAAVNKGRTFSQDAIRGSTQPFVPPTMVSSFIRGPRDLYRGALAASIAIFLFAGGFATHLGLGYWKKASLHNSMVTRPLQPQNSPHNDSNAENDVVAQLRATHEADRETVAGLEEKVSETLAQLEEAQHSLSLYKTEQSSLVDQVNQRNGQITALESQVAGREQNVAQLHAQLEQLQQRVSDGQATLAANELRVRDLNDQLTSQTASLDREREMLTVGRDVRDLMGARNLHIIDVHDSNGVGKDQKSFGRIFYTEGKQLIFYAFDLDDKRVMNASYSYQAWGENLGQPSSVKSLGILYVDDKVQRRWSLKVDDPHRLAEINSVFVTVEPHGRQGDKPQGKPVLFAFLGGEANHP